MAQKDIRSAKILFEHEADNEIVCFHCQQAIEKYLKGYLVHITGRVQEGHSLVRLCKKASTYQEVFKSLVKLVAIVDIYYIETRYPAADPLLVSREDAAECLQTVEIVVQQIDKLLKEV